MTGGLPLFAMQLSMVAVPILIFMGIRFLMADILGVHEETAGLCAGAGVVVGLVLCVPPLASRMVERYGEEKHKKDE